MKISNYIEDFLLVKEVEEGCAKSTVKAYRYDLQNFIKHIGDLEIEHPKMKENIRLYLRKLNDLNYSKKAIARKIASLRSLFKFLTVNEYILRNPMITIRTPRIKTEENLPKFLDLKDIEFIMNQIQNKQIFNSKKSQRYYLVVRLLYSTMARISELVNIKVRDIDFDNGYIRLRGKGNKERIVPLDTKTIEIIKENLEKRLFYDSEDFLIVNIHGQQMKPRSIEMDFQNIKKKLDLPESTKFTPHILRHTGATHLRRAGMDISELQDILGHSNPNTTMIYAKNDITQIKKSYGKMHPLNKNNNL